MRTLLLLTGLLLSGSALPAGEYAGAVLPPLRPAFSANVNLGRELPASPQPGHPAYDEPSLRELIGHAVNAGRPMARMVYHANGSAWEYTATADGLLHRRPVADQPQPDPRQAPPPQSQPAPQYYAPARSVPAARPFVPAGAYPTTPTTTVTGAGPRGGSWTGTWGAGNTYTRAVTVATRGGTSGCPTGG